MKHLFLSILLLATTAVIAGEKNVSIERDFGTLHGTLLTPDSGSETVALIIAGSGPTDRNGNSIMGLAPNSYLYLAQALENAGIASLRYDKRGVGASQYADPQKMSEVVFGDFIGDAVAWADFLKKEGFRRIVLIGHSEGSLIAIMAAQQSDAVDSVISVSGAGFPIDEILQLQLSAQLIPDHMDLMMQANRIITSLKAGKRVDDYPQELTALFHPIVQPFLISQFQIDPRAEIRKLDIPIIIIGGDNDIQITPDNAEALAKAQPKAKLVIIKDMTHPLKKCDGRTMQEQMSAYTSSDLPLDSDLSNAIINFINQ